MPHNLLDRQAESRAAMVTSARMPAPAEVLHVDRLAERSEELPSQGLRSEAMPLDGLPVTGVRPEEGDRERIEPLPHGWSIVVPVYRGEATLGALVERLERVLSSRGEPFEILLVNDGSPDASWSVICELTARYPAIRGVNLLRNYGQHNATLCGLRLARFDVTITMDDDLQHAPEHIPKLVDKLLQGHDVVYGAWSERKQGFLRATFAALTKHAVAWVMGAGSVRDIGAFRAIRTDVRRAFAAFDGSEVLLDVLLSWGTSRFASVRVEEAERAGGASNYTFWKLARVSLLVLTSYTTAPLRIANLVGLCFTVFGAAAFVRVLYVYFWLGSIPGFSFLAATILLFGGVQLFALGILGEYLARIFNRTTGRPPYTVGQLTR
jgi:glycosyltransferase involved in cell wall biosynthesis